MSASPDGMLLCKRAACAGELGINIVLHPDNVAMPNMTDPGDAFQMYDPDENWHDSNYDYKLRFVKPIYTAGHNPHMLARAVMDAGRQVRPALLPRCLRQCAHSSEWTQSLSLVDVCMALSTGALACGTTGMCDGIKNLNVKVCAGGVEAWKAAYNGSGGSPMHSLHAGQPQAPHH
jgi:hypothetical protein